MWILEGAGRALESAFFRGRFDESQIWALGQPLPCTFALLLYALSSACGSCLRHHTGAPRRCASLPSSPPPHSAHTLVGLGISDSRARCTGQVLPTWPQVRMPRAALETPSAPSGTQTNESRAAGPGAQARAAFESPGGFQRAAWLRSAAQNPGATGTERASGRRSRAPPASGGADAPQQGLASRTGMRPYSCSWSQGSS